MDVPAFFVPLADEAGVAAGVTTAGGAAAGVAAPEDEAGEGA